MVRSCACTDIRVCSFIFSKVIRDTWAGTSFRSRFCMVSLSAMAYLYSPARSSCTNVS